MNPIQNSKVMVEKFDLFNYSLIPYFGKDSNSARKHELAPLNLKIFFFKFKKKKPEIQHLT